MTLPQPFAEGFSVRRAVIALYGVAGCVLTWSWKDYGRDYARLLLGVACIAVCVGLWRSWRWARWLALGTCFLALIAAFAMPVLMALCKYCCRRP